MNGTLSAVTALLLTGLPLSWVQLYRLQRLKWDSYDAVDGAMLIGIVGSIAYFGGVWLFHTVAAGLPATAQLAYGVSAAAVAAGYVALVSPELRDHAL